MDTDERVEETFAEKVVSIFFAFIATILLIFVSDPYSEEYNQKAES